MLYCDLTIDTTNIWSGVLCENLVDINGGAAQGFSGELFFNDLQGGEDPDYTGLGPGGRFQFIYVEADGATQDQIPLLAQPNQQVQVALGNQNCLINLYTRTATLTES